MTRFDWYQATVYVQDPTRNGLLPALLNAWELSDFAPDRGMHGYTHGGRISRGSTKLCTLWWGGNPGVNITASSTEAPVLAQALRALNVSYGITRVDSCADWVEEGAFDSLSGHLIAFAQANGISIEQRGDWIRGQARTLYLGSPQSPVRICLYEKGYEQGGDAPRDWTRLEVRVRPKGEHRIAVSRWEPDDVFCAGWVADALAVLGWDDLKKRAVGTVWRRSDAERSRIALCKQYGGIIAEWASELGGWDALPQAMRALIDDKPSQPTGAGAERLVEI